MRLREIASTNTVCLNEGDSIDKAIALMEQHHIRHLPVMAGSRVIGIVSARDLLSSVGWLKTRERVSRVEGPAVIGPRRVQEIMSAPVKMLSPDDRVEQAARLMVSEKISAVPLVHDSRLVGIATETNCLRCYLDDRTIAPGSGWRFLKVGDHMTSPVVSLKPSDAPQLAFKLMQERRIRHLPVVERGKLVGIVSDRDVRKSFFRDTVEILDDGEALTRLAQPTDLRVIMRRNARTIGPSSTLADAAGLMVERTIGALPVVEDDELIGIISETDLLKALIAARV